MYLISRILIFCAFSFLCVSSFAQKRKKDCFDLTITQAVNQKYLSADLAVIDINSRELACPQFTDGDSTLCGQIKRSDGTWSAMLPDRLIWTLFFEKSHYENSKSILHDPFFIKALEDVPDPSQEAMAWFLTNWRNHYMLLPLDNEDYLSVTELDALQMKMITVFHQIKSWTFCAEKNETSSSIVHGKYDTLNNIILYRTACQAKSIYRSDIKKLAVAFKFHFIGAHELSHAIDDASGNLVINSVNAKVQLERKANVNGLIITKAIAHLFDSFFEFHKSLVQKSTSPAFCDLVFVNETVSKYKRVQGLFSKEINKAKRRIKSRSTDQLLENEWSTMGCVEAAIE